jgi:hypothetical protein
VNIKQKYKELNIKLTKILGRKVWLLPMVETLVFLPIQMLYFINESSFLVDNVNGYISSFSFILFKYGLTNNQFFLILLGFVPFILKMVSAFFMLKGKHRSYVFAMVLYLIDFISSLVILCSSATTLQEWSAVFIVFLFVTIWITPVISASYYGCYLMSIKKLDLSRDKTPKGFSVYLTSLILILITVVSFVWFDGNKKIANMSEVATLNRCYEYSEKYLYEELPEDRMILEKMQSDIEEVFSKELFFIAFNQSAYFDRLKTEQKAMVDIADQVPIKIKSEYANELMYLKCKILLKLDKDEEYINYYAETRKYFSWTTIYSKHLNQDNYNFTHDDYDAIEKGCIKFLESDALEYEKVFCITDYGFVNSKFFTDEERKTKGKELIEKYIPEYENLKETLGKEFREWEAVERSLYMLK